MAYNGNNYIFVSYSHKDSSRVLPFIDILNTYGYNVWYDAGIEAGTEWPEYIEDHLKDARVVLVFMTPNTVESKNCRNEINFALELNKDILIVYLEDTVLLKGMRLQLNSTQSLYYNNHATKETFIKALVNAVILQPCRTNPNTNTFASEKRAPKQEASSATIANICSIGTNDENDLWPKGLYSETINRDEFRVVFFHATLLKPIGFSGSIKTKAQIYNSNNDLIFSKESSLQVVPEYDRFSTGWILKGLDGSFVPAGEYRFVWSIHNSPPFTYRFFVTANHESAPTSSSKGSFWKTIADIFMS